MADGTGETPSRPGSGRPPTYVPSYDAPTGPLPRMSLDQALAGTQAATSRPDADRDVPAYGSPAEADSETTMQIDAVRIWAADSVRVLPGADTDPDAEDDADDPGTGTDPGTELDLVAEADDDDTADPSDTVDVTDAVRAASAARAAGAADTADTDTTGDVRRQPGAFPPTGAALGVAGVPGVVGVPRLPADQAPLPPDGPTVPAGFLRRRPYAPAGDDDTGRGVRESAVPRVRQSDAMPPWPEPVDEAPPTPAVVPRRPDGPLSAAILRAGDVPIKVVYGIGAALVTAVIVVLIFVLFAGDRPDDPVRVDPARGGGPGATTPVKPKPTPIVVPPVPAARPMTVFDGTGTPVASYVQDQKTGISYPQYAGPWAKATRPGFAAAQKVGSSARPQTLIGSAPLPGALNKQPRVYSDFRALAARAAKWSLRHQPQTAKFNWTVSQRTRYGVGWMLGYKLTYRVDGKKHTSQSYVMVVATGRAKPAMLFATVPDTRPALYRDLNMLFWAVRPI
ncbi:hypothetical protein [Sphaerisporangium aureirubrum]|uniref:Serine/threonine protein kinase n=1 Tax=Sphaerisporangium aureirubrum TaxID=1544736 RepID=A0ABW1NRI8_9ACTN